ncbi:MAG TPA: phage tail protein [Sphingomicrobium sp.]|nr:phage tail protein [Sphingomicrobium sp.]
MARDYQSGQMRASAGQNGRRQVHIDFPAVIEPDAAKALAQSSLARQWAKRERLTLRLSPEYLDIVPGDAVRLTSGSQDWQVERATIEQMVVVAELKRAWREASALAADAGRAVGNYDVVAPSTSIALFDLPDLGISPSQAPVLHLATASGAREWRPVPIEISVNGAMSAGHSAIGETLMGIVTAVPAPGQAALIDELATLEVELVSDAMWLTSCDDIALCEGANLAIVGNELIQFGRADPIGPNQFRLWRLLRGRRGTEWATEGHVAGERFAIVETDALRPIELGQASLGAEVSVRARGLGDGDAALPVSRIAAGEALRPPSPVHLTAVRRADNGLAISWVRRSRFGWAWVDSVDAPLGETVERYHVRLSGAAGAIELDSTVSSASIPAADVASLGAGSASITVSQIGDFAASHEAALTIILP